MEEKTQPTILEGQLVGTIRFGLASHKEISTASVSDCPISHSSQLTNPFLGLPLEFGKCRVLWNFRSWAMRSFKCKRMLSLLCLKCLKLKTNKISKSGGGVGERLMSCCEPLSYSVKMVAIGVLKEHLILLANSMTCAGNLVGINSGGYKALSRSLDIQVPFTEATVFTPRKCFERAAEKCHLDSLSSVLASCSWGKHVAVGTGSRFDVLWDQK